jgi:hypothetical protein
VAAPGDALVPDCDGELHRSIAVTNQAGVVLAVGGVGITLSTGANGGAPLPLEGGEGLNVPRAVHWAGLQTSTYVLTHFALPQPAEVDFRAYLTAPLVADSCPSSTVVQLDSVDATVLDLVPGQENGWTRVSGGGRTYGMALDNLSSTTGPTAGAVDLCDGCGADATCTLIPFGQVTTVVVGDQAAVRLTNVLSFAPWGRIEWLPTMP